MIPHSARCVVLHEGGRCPERRLPGRVVCASHASMLDRGVSLRCVPPHSDEPLSNPIPKEKP